MSTENRETHVVAAEAITPTPDESFDTKRMIVDNAPNDRGPLLACFKVTSQSFGSPIIFGTFREAIDFLRGEIGPHQLTPGGFAGSVEEVDSMLVEMVEMREKDLDDLPEWDGY